MRSLSGYSSESPNSSCAFKGRIDRRTVAVYHFADQLVGLVEGPAPDGAEFVRTVVREVEKDTVRTEAIGEASLASHSVLVRLVTTQTDGVADSLVERQHTSDVLAGQHVVVSLIDLIQRIGVGHQLVELDLPTVVHG